MYVARAFVRMFACTYVCTYVCMYVCMYAGHALEACAAFFPNVKT
jgi:hypothetical protein